MATDSGSPDSNHDANLVDGTAVVQVSDCNDAWPGTREVAEQATGNVPGDDADGVGGGVEPQRVDGSLEGGQHVHSRHRHLQNLHYHRQQDEMFHVPVTLGAMADAQVDQQVSGEVCSP